jgi:hypothetical protein
MEQHRLTQEAVFGAVVRLREEEGPIGSGEAWDVTTAIVHAELAKEDPDSSFRTPTREAVYLQLHRLKKKRLLLSKRQGKEVSWELAARGRRLLEQKAQHEELEAKMKQAAEELEAIGALTTEEAESCAGWLREEQAERGPEGVGIEREHVTDGSECWCSPVTEKVVDLEETVELDKGWAKIGPTLSYGTIETDGALRDADPIYLEGSPEPNSDQEDDGA